jgi:hypothetical protein
MILYMAPASVMEAQMKKSPEDMKKGMEPWLAWFKRCEKSIVDNGNMLGNGMHFTKAGSSKGQTEVTGYSIVQAKDMEGAKAIIADHPHFMMPKATIEILEIIPMM